MIENKNNQEWLVLRAMGKIPEEIIDFMTVSFEIMEIRALVCKENGVAFEVRTREHNHATPHVHASYGSYSISISLENGEVLDGNLPPKQAKFAVNWVLKHKELLLGKWQDIVISAISTTTKSRLDEIL